MTGWHYHQCDANRLFIKGWSDLEFGTALRCVPRRGRLRPGGIIHNEGGVPRHQLQSHWQR